MAVCWINITRQIQTTQSKKEQENEDLQLFKNSVQNCITPYRHLKAIQWDVRNEGKVQMKRQVKHLKTLN